MTFCWKISLVAIPKQPRSSRALLMFFYTLGRVFLEYSSCGFLYDLCRPSISLLHRELISVRGCHNHFIDSEMFWTLSDPTSSHSSFLGANTFFHDIQCIFLPAYNVPYKKFILIFSSSSMMNDGALYSEKNNMYLSFQEQLWSVLLVRQIKEFLFSM